MKKTILVLSGLLCITASNIYATPIDGVLSNAVAGSDMAGMLVTVGYANGSSQTAEWQAGTGNIGAATGTDWSLSFAGSDTWFSNYLDDFIAPGVPNTPDRRAYWEFEATGNAVTSITIDAIAGDTVFDIFAIWDPNWSETGFPNTEDSGDGWWQANSYERTDTSGFDSLRWLSWEFTDPITIDGVVAEDLYGSLTIGFDNPYTPWQDSMTGTLSFGVDTDNISPVPEPATMVLFGVGLVGLLGAGRNRKIQKQRNC